MVMNDEHIAAEDAPQEEHDHDSSYDLFGAAVVIGKKKPYTP